MAEKGHLLLYVNIAIRNGNWKPAMAVQVCNGRYTCICLDAAIEFEGRIVAYHCTPSHMYNTPIIIRTANVLILNNAQEFECACVYSAPRV